MEKVRRSYVFNKTKTSSTVLNKFNINLCMKRHEADFLKKIVHRAAVKNP